MIKNQWEKFSELLLINSELDNILNGESCISPNCISTGCISTSGVLI